MSERRRPDPYAGLRHLDGRPVTLAVPELIEDVDGDPLGVNTTTTHTGTLALPPLEDEEGDQ